MSEFATNNPWTLALIALLIGGLIGVLITLFIEQRKSGGRSVEDLQREMDDYKEEVGNHFATTSELFRDMTEKYRDVYNHLASGSQALCEDSMEHARLEFIEARSVTAADGDTPESAAADQSAPPGAEGDPGKSADAPADAVSDTSVEKKDAPPLGV